jgi:hypothetical protein
MDLGGLATCSTGAKAEGGRRASAKQGAAGKKAKAGPQKKKADGPKRAVVRTGGGTKYCRGCKKKVDISMFQVNQDLDVDCKKLYDRIWKVANRQGQLEWLKAIYHDDDRLSHLLSRFHETTKGNAKKNPFKVAEYKEKFCAKSMVINDDQGEMLEEDDFVTHMMARSSAQARAIVVR